MTAASSSGYAVIKTGGQQVKVAAGAKVFVGKLVGEVGSSVTFSEVLMINTGDGASLKVGTPLVQGAKVTGKILAHKKDAKVLIYRKNRRTGFTKKQGHRQDKTQVLIENIG